MSAPIVFISHFRVKDLAAYERMAPEVVRRLQAEKPQTAAFLHYLDREDSRLTIVHLFADAEALDRHLEGAETRGEQAAHPLARDIGTEATIAVWRSVDLELHGSHFPS